MALAEFLARQFRRPSGLFGRLLMGMVLNKGNARINDRAVELLAVEPGDHVVDVGFGGGAALRTMASQVGEGRVFGVELSQEMIGRASRRLRREIRAGTIAIREADVTNLPFENGALEGACTINTVYFWPDPVAAFHELRRVLRPGGRLVVGIRSRDRMQQLTVTRHGFTLYDASELERLLREAGFDDVETQYHDREPTMDSVLIAGTAQGCPVLRHFLRAVARLHIS